MKKINNIENIDELRVEALLQFLNAEDERVTEYDVHSTDWATYEVEGEEYKVLTDEEATLCTKINIRETCSYFTADFLEVMTGIPAIVFEHLEGADEAVLETIEKTCGIDEFVDEAIRWDGRGHFLANYDGEENEVDVTDEDGKDATMYIYRTN